MLSFSRLPLRLSLYLGGTMTALGLGVAGWGAVQWTIRGCRARSPVQAASVEQEPESPQERGGGRRHGGGRPGFAKSLGPEIREDPCPGFHASLMYFAVTA